MGVKTITLTDAPSAVLSITGGTSISTITNGVMVTNGVFTVVPTDAETVRRQIIWKNRPASFDPKTGTYGKDKKSCQIVQPLVLASGQTVFCTLRIEREIHPEVSSADAWNLLKLGAQVMHDTEAVNFWSYGSLD